MAEQRLGGAWVVGFVVEDLGVLRFPALFGGGGGRRRRDAGGRVCGARVSAAAWAKWADPIPRVPRPGRPIPGFLPTGFAKVPEHPRNRVFSLFLFLFLFLEHFLIIFLFSI